MYLDKAEELGRLIGQTEEFKALKRAREALEAAGDLRIKFDRMEVLAEGLQRQAAESKEPDEREVEEYDRVFGEVQTDSRYQQLVAAQANFDKLMLRVQERIAEGMQKGAESSIITLT